MYVKTWLHAFVFVYKSEHKTSGQDGLVKYERAFPQGQ